MIVFVPHRIHASVLRYIQKVKDYNQECEEMLLKFLTAAEESPFIKSKQGRVPDGEPKKRKKVAVEDAVSKKVLNFLSHPTPFEYEIIYALIYFIRRIWLSLAP